MMVIHPIVNGKNIGYDDFNVVNGEEAMADDLWAERAKSLLKAELKRRNVSYRDLAEKLTGLGVPESERNIANKISRGGFTAAFFFQCMEAIGCRTLSLQD